MNQRQIIPALDVTDLTVATAVVEAVGQHPGIYGFKLGFSLGLSHGLPRVVETIRRHSNKPVIYDHQKAATDIPDTGALFARVLKQAGVDEAILFPQAGPETLRAWASALVDEGLTTIVGGAMTHRAYLHSEGGFLVDSAATDIYRLAYAAGVRRFVMPLTKPDLVRRLWQQAGLDDSCILYSPGYGAQKGQLAPFSWVPAHLVIVGRALLQAADPVAYIDGVLDEWKGQP
ncbi:MAG: orotidine 5'-phosphate decarboxylase / HUMPS family protein [Pseudomonadota bacterium]